MKNLKNKLNKKGGFTLIEMLIVVAIIAILVAVSIPVVNSALERARVATDAANERAAKAEIVVCYLSEKLSDGTTEFKANTVYCYDAANGTLVADGSTIAKGYGKCTQDATGKHKDQIIVIQIDNNGVVTMGWIAKPTSSTTPTMPTDPKLCMNSSIL